VAKPIVSAGANSQLTSLMPTLGAEATASIVRYVRRQFPFVRAFVPPAAMCVGTMWSLAAAERIVMGSHSLGPIDPQHVTHGPPAFRAYARAYVAGRRSNLVVPNEALELAADVLMRALRRQTRSARSSRLVMWPVTGPGPGERCRLHQ
jgi:Serine dehydrogenase proteinase